MFRLLCFLEMFYLCFVFSLEMLIEVATILRDNRNLTVLLCAPYCLRRWYSLGIETAILSKKCTNLGLGFLFL